ncbi:amylo-alpha-1,6-glucosidase [Thermococcus sp. SY098]|uniref:amylo-alpha-1,6-glucosidase n=1 Tax=Thermococcus sp. SY098 TaxID=3111325 RepID=UPI002D76988C|nr:amylo-alpha-1,6-glucosidase [Thermococcus sp. SY098]WRS52510.1 amylo-alpha-1,6-glucosidase [Thermococcus sp. SY098]
MSKVTLAFNGAFVLSDEKGDMNKHYHGFYAFDTRFVKNISLEIGKEMFLGHIGHDNMTSISRILIGGSVILLRKRELLNGWRYREELTFYNMAKEPAKILPKYFFEVCFEDIFEVRGNHKPLKRKIIKKQTPKGIRYTYIGIDKIKRELEIKAKGFRFESNYLTSEISLKPLEKKSISIEFSPKIHIKSAPFLIRNVFNFKFEQRVITSNIEVNNIFKTSLKDLASLTVLTNHGLTVFAGIPYFMCLFGRDSIITSLFLLPYFPEYAKGTLKILSKLQGRKFDKKTLEESGKIPHEYRLGELSQANLMPFAPYYGTVDSTPLYLILAGEYVRWTRDYNTVKELKDTLNKALEWIFMKLEEGDGYVRYSLASPYVQMNQGWKDSKEGVPDEHGEPTKPPIALVEVQGYVYKALLDMARLSDILEFEESTLREEAKKLRRKFNTDFWMKKEKFYAIALNGNNKPSKVISSNPGHLLFTGIAEHEKEVAERLFKKDMFSGWGIRTLSSKEKAYNPFSYHNGSVWAHDNALIALGLAKIGETEKAAFLADKFLKAANLMNYQLPELFSGVRSEIPLPIPRANVPQAWSAATPFAFLTAMLGLTPEGVSTNPQLPEHLEKIEIKTITIGGTKYRITIEKKDEQIRVDMNKSH